MVDNLVIKASNIALFLTAIYGAGKAFQWKLRNHISPETMKIVFAWVLIFLSVGIRAIWFAASRHFADEGETWSAQMYEWRSVIVILTALLFAWGMFSFVRHIEYTPKRRQIILFSVIVCVSLFISSF
jgi:hypothetical protein